MRTYELVVIGGGPGGYVAAIKAAQLGMKVAMIEKEAVGGICLNHGCIPTKTLIKSSKVYRTIRHSQDYGVTIDGEIKVDWKAMLKRKDQAVKRLTGGVSSLLKKNGVDVIKGEARVISKSEIEVNDEKLETKDLIIATGARPIIPPIPGLKEAYDKGIVRTSRELLVIKEVPKSLVIIGGGVIGVEFATIFASLGTKVTIIEKLDNILTNFDHDIVESYRKLLKKDRIDIHTGAEVKKVDGNRVTYQEKDEEKTIESEAILLSVGMRANSEGLEALGLETDRGMIVTNDRLETSVKNVYAIGDVNGKYMLAHVASAEGITAVENINGKDSELNYSHVPNAVYGIPEIASVGLTEQEAKEKGLDYETSTFPLAANGRALAENERDGSIKLIVSPEYREIIGAHILAYNASDLIAEIGVTLELEGTAHELAHTIHAHPTLSEIVMEAAHGAIDKPIHF
ncbi:MAG: dihydrolipoyl dehydrogenase [Acholeplasmataceae bacterium]